MKTELKSKEDFIKAELNCDRLSPLQWTGILRAMQRFSDQNCEHTQDMFTAPNHILNPLEDLYRKEHPRPDGKFYIPDRTEFYTWIVEKIMKEPVSYVPYMLCPKCGGSGYVYAGIGTSINTSAICDVCNGKKIIPMHTL